MHERTNLPPFGWEGNDTLDSSLYLAGVLSAPKVRNATAWGNAPGNLPANPEALKARHTKRPLLHFSTIPRLQRFGQDSTVNLGRWPRLLHHAPLALKDINAGEALYAAN